LPANDTDDGNGLTNEAQARTRRSDLGPFPLEWVMGNEPALSARESAVRACHMAWPAGRSVRTWPWETARHRR